MKRFDLVLTGILACALGVRLWGIEFGLPQTLCRPDELQIADEAFMLFRGQPIPPNFIGYPTFFIYVLMAVYTAFLGLGRLTGRFDSLIDFLVEYHDDPSSFLLLGRTVSALLGVATVLFVYRAARHLFGPAAARVSALFMAFAYLHVRDSHFGTMDVTATMLLTASLFYLLRCLGARSLGPFVAAGVFAGLCASAKFVGVLMVVPLCAVHVMNLRGEPRATRRWFDARPLAFAASAALAFVAGTPGAVAHPVEFFSSALGEVRHLRGGHGDVVVGGWEHLSFSLSNGLGLPLFALGVVGAVLFSVRAPRHALIVLSFPVLYALIAGSGSTAFVRYAIPLLPFVCLTAAFAVVEIARGIARRPGPAAALATALAALAVLPSLWSSLAFDRLMAKSDTRTLAAEWIGVHVPGGSSMCMTSGYGRVKLPPHDSILEEDLRRSVQEDPEGNYARMVEGRLRKRELVGHSGFFECRYLPEKDVFRMTRFGRTVAVPDYIVVADSPLGRYDSLPQRLRELIESDYEIVREFSGHVAGIQASRYDRTDAFFLPYTHFEGITRPGPNIIIFARQ